MEEHGVSKAENSGGQRWFFFSSLKTRPYIMTEK